MRGHLHNVFVIFNTSPHEGVMKDGSNEGGNDTELTGYLRTKHPTP
jgi:hypothetical protein